MGIFPWRTSKRVRTIGWSPTFWPLGVTPLFLAKLACPLRNKKPCWPGSGPLSQILVRRRRVGSFVFPRGLPPSLLAALKSWPQSSPYPWLGARMRGPNTSLVKTPFASEAMSHLKGLRMPLSNLFTSLGSWKFYNFFLNHTCINRSKVLSYHDN